MSTLSKIISFPIRVYRYLISPLFPGHCRHSPTCSAYALQAIKVHGPFKGLWYALKRIGRCHPWGSSGYDPVPGTKEYLEWIKFGRRKQPR